MSRKPKPIHKHTLKLCINGKRIMAREYYYLFKKMKRQRKLKKKVHLTLFTLIFKISLKNMVQNIDQNID